MLIKIAPNAFDPYTEIQRYQSDHPDFSGKAGATNIFLGSMRDFNEGDSIHSMELEHYPGMTEKQLRNIALEASSKWQVDDVLIIHRVGTIVPQQTIVLLAVWSAHRGDAFDACRYIMEALKKKAPFWKQETLTSNSKRWVNKNTDGYFQKGRQLDKENLSAS